MSRDQHFVQYFATHQQPIQHHGPQQSWTNHEQHRVIRKQAIQRQLIQWRIQ